MPEPFSNNDFWWNGGSSTATGSTLGSFWNEISGKTQSEEAARVFNSAEAQKTRDWQEFMSNSALQRQVADAKAAGINPASLQGNGASTPSSSPASASPSGMGNGGVLGIIGSVATAAIGKALMAKYLNTAQTAKQQFELPKLLAAVEKDKATAQKMMADSKLKEALTGNAKGDRRLAHVRYGKDGKVTGRSEDVWY